MTSSESQPRTRAGVSARSVMLHRLEACARKYPGFPAAAVWQDDLDAIEAEAAQDSLPSPAPEPPPGEDRLSARSGCNCAPDADGYIIHNSWRHERAAQPAPDLLDVGLLNEALEYTGTALPFGDVDLIAARYAFLKSGGKP